MIGSISKVQKSVGFYFDESGFNQSGLSVLCCVITDEAIELGEGVSQLKEDVLHNHRLRGILGDFNRNGFHHCDDHIEIRNLFVEYLATQSFEAYICYSIDSEPDHRNDLYDKMFGRMLKDRLQPYRNHQITVFYEQHDSKRQRRLDELTAIASRVCQEIDGFHHSSVDVRIVEADKNEPCLAVADYICAIFCAYYNELHKQERSAGEPLAKRNFDALRGKIRLIHDMDADQFYSRRRPFPGLT